MDELHVFSRAELLLGEEKLEKLRKARVAVFGIGGVGSFAAEAIARGGVGHIALIDGDTVSLTNINRQLIALHSTVGREKTAVMAERIHDICPETEVVEYPVNYTAENKDLIDFASYDYIVDAIDMVTSKLLLIEEAKKAGTEVISCMGTGNKLHPEMLEIADISKTSVCPLARVMRTELRKRGINHLKVVYSKEEPIKGADGERIIGSVAFVPSVAGLMMAGEIVRNIVEKAEGGLPRE